MVKSGHRGLVAAIARHATSIGRPRTFDNCRPGQECGEADKAENTATIALSHAITIGPGFEQHHAVTPDRTSTNRIHEWNTESQSPPTHRGSLDKT